MPSLLYLDAARFGAILPQCAEMLREFAELLQTCGSFPQFDEFLDAGAECWPDSLRCRFPVLSCWQGIESLRHRVRQLLDLPDSAAVLFSGSSRELTRIAVRCLLARSEHVLCSDFDWPDFRQVLAEQAERHGSVLHSVTLRDPFAAGEVKVRVAAHIAAAVKRHRCDGLWLTPVSLDGLTVGVDDVLTRSHPLRPYLVVDGSQQAGHLPVRLGAEFRGVYLGSTHKWLRSGVPLSFAVLADGQDSDRDRCLLRRALRSCVADDMILLRTADVGLPIPRQTMRIEPLLAASLALEAALAVDATQMAAIRRQNAQAVVGLCRDLPVPLHASCSSGIVRLIGVHVDPDAVQAAFARCDVTVSVPDGHCVRVSCPDMPFTASDLQQVHDALASTIRLTDDCDAQLTMRD